LAPVFVSNATILGLSQYFSGVALDENDELSIRSNPDHPMRNPWPSSDVAAHQGDMAHGSWWEVTDRMRTVMWPRWQGAAGCGQFPSILSIATILGILQHFSGVALDKKIGVYTVQKLDSPSHCFIQLNLNFNIFTHSTTFSPNGHVKFGCNFLLVHWIIFRPGCG
jgi:hypothetical protein